MEPNYQHIHQYGGVHVDYMSGGGGGGGDRLPQWSIEEARDLLVIRADLDAAFMESKRNRPLWELVATKMREKGYNRTAEQCKCKWKNLVTRYKFLDKSNRKEEDIDMQLLQAANQGCETMETESMRQQFPLYSELQAIFAGRMQRMLWLEEEGAKKGNAEHLLSDEEDENNEDSEEEVEGNKKKRKRILKGSSSSNYRKSEKNNKKNSNILREVLDEFMKQQKEIEMEWMKSYEAREEERRRREMEWRQTMEALEKERLMMERRWREREGQRRVREEAKAEKRDALITLLLQKISREEKQQE